MASITKRISKEGAVSYLVRVYYDRDGSGRQITRSTTYTPKQSASAAKMEREAQRYADRFEEQIRSGLIPIDGKTLFGDYAREWLDKATLAPKTRDRYEELLERIIPAIGHIKLEKLQARHLKSFYQNLAEEGVNRRGRYAVATTFDAVCVEKHLSRSEIAKRAGLSTSTVGAARRGAKISVATAEKIAAVLEKKPSSLFEIHESDRALSDKTILHHHRLISAILADAKRERIVPFNVAQEHMKAPRVEEKEPAYLTDEQARKFVALLFEEPDIRIKTALMLLITSGLRRGELCGIELSDLDFDNRLVHVLRAAQYQKRKGVTEVPTKNRSSRRAVKLPGFMMDILRDYLDWRVSQRFSLGSLWRGEQERLFVQHDGRPINPDTINYWLEKFIAKNNLPRITPHGLRHTFATLQITSGVDIRTLQSRTGHAQASTLVNIYSHAIRSAAEAATDTLEEVLLRPSAKTESVG